MKPVRGYAKSGPKGAIQSASKSSSKTASYRSVKGGVPPIAPRKGTNNQKELGKRRERQRVKRKGILKRAFSFFRVMVIIALVIVSLGGAGLLAYRAFENNGFLVMRDVEISGNSLWDRASILEKAGLELGSKLPLVSVAKIENALLALPGIENVDVHRIYPSRLEIRIQEKAPVACGYAKGWFGLTPDGAAIPGFNLQTSDLPVVDGFASLGPERRAALGRFLERVRKEYPALYANFSQLSVMGKPAAMGTRRGGFQRAAARAPGMLLSHVPGKVGAVAPAPSPYDLEIVLRDARLRVLVGMGNKSLSSLEFLQALMKQQSASLEPGKTVDLRVEGFAYVR